MTIEIRSATEADVGILLGLIRDLAVYEKKPVSIVQATEEDLKRDGFGLNRRFEARLAFIDGVPVGFTLFFPDYSTWEGRAGLFLEDIFVAETARRRGIGRALMADLAAIARARVLPCARLRSHRGVAALPDRRQGAAQARARLGGRGP
jgi:GNAT superfamily N-acetyltransferase